MSFFFSTCSYYRDCFSTWYVRLRLEKKKKQSKGATRHGDGSVCPASELGSQEAKEGQPRDGTSGGGVGARFSRYTVVPLDFQGAKSRRKSHQEVGYRRKASFPR